MTNGVDVSVIDIGRINPFSIETAEVKPDKFERAIWGDKKTPSPISETKANNKSKAIAYSTNCWRCN